MVTDKLKQLIFKRLYKELGNAEIIPYNDSIWFIDRDRTYWYFELTKMNVRVDRHGKYIRHHQ